MRTFIQIAKVVVSAGQLSGNIDINFSTGAIAKCVSVYGISAIDDVFTRASIKNNAGLEIVPMHNINNFRDREAAYFAAKMPIDMKESRTASINVLLAAVSGVNKTYEFVFVMESEN